MPSQLPKIRSCLSILKKMYWSTNSFLSIDTLRNAGLINGTSNSRNAPTAAKKFNTVDPATFDVLPKTPPQPGKPKAPSAREPETPFENAHRNAGKAPILPTPINNAPSDNLVNFSTPPPKTPSAREPGTPFENAHTNVGKAPILPTPVNNAPSHNPVNFSAPPPKPSTPLFSGLQAKDPKGSNVSGSSASTSGSNSFGAASPSPAQSAVSSSTPNVLATVLKGTGLESSALSPGTKAGKLLPFHIERDAGSIARYQAITSHPMYSQFSFEVRHSQSRCLA